MFVLNIFIYWYGHDPFIATWKRYVLTCCEMERSNIDVLWLVVPMQLCSERWNSCYVWWWHHDYCAGSGRKMYTIDDLYISYDMYLINACVFLLTGTVWRKLLFLNQDHVCEIRCLLGLRYQIDNIRMVYCVVTSHRRVICILIVSTDSTICSSDADTQVSIQV